MARVPEFDAHRVGSSSLHKTMSAITLITDIVGANIYWHDVSDEDIPLPYVTIGYMEGGWENTTDANAADMIYEILMHTANKTTANTARTALNKLHRAVLDVSDFANVAPYSTIRQVYPYMMRDPAQNLPVYSVGGYYRIRFIV